MLARPLFWSPKTQIWLRQKIKGKEKKGSEKTTSSCCSLRLTHTKVNGTAWLLAPKSVRDKNLVRGYQTQRNNLEQSWLFFLCLKDKQIFLIWIWKSTNPCQNHFCCLFVAFCWRCVHYCCFLIRRICFSGDFDDFSVWTVLRFQNSSQQRLSGFERSVWELFFLGPLSFMTNSNCWFICFSHN